MIAFDIQKPDGNWYGTDNVTINDGGVLNFEKNSQKSCIRVRKYSAAGINVKNISTKGQFCGVIQADKFPCTSKP